MFVCRYGHQHEHHVRKWTLKKIARFAKKLADLIEKETKSAGTTVPG